MAATETHPNFLFEDGSQLTPKARVPGPSQSPFDAMTKAQLRSHVADLWADAFEAKRAETERLKTCSLYYDGFHYTNPWLNRTNPVTNYCFSVVETVVPAMTQQRPRPEIVPRRAGFSSDQVNNLADAANWLMDVGKWDVAIHLGARDKAIYGWNCWLVSMEYKTGMPFVKNLSVFDVYWDAAARNDEEAEYFFIATPVATNKLQATYPKLARWIKPDGLASPSYDVTVRPWQDFLDDSHRYEHPNTLSSGLLFRKEAESEPTGQTSLVASTGEYRAEGRTTLVLQLIIRDDSLREDTYVGDLTDAEGNVTPGMHHKHSEPVCRSGWRLVSMTAGGMFLENHALGEFYGGTPLVFDFDYRRTDRFAAMGEIDNVIPLQRKDNRRSALINRAIELMMNPPIITNRDSGLPADKGTVAGGELIRITRGSELKYLEFRTPIEEIANLQVMDARAMDTVTGVQDVSQGQRPAGIEAAAAIRRLQEAAQVRIRGKEAQASDARCRLLKKLMTCAGKKLNGEIAFQSSGGGFVTMDAAALSDEFDIRFAPGTGTVEGKDANEEKAFALFDRQAIDVPELLKAVDWKNRDEVAARMQAQQQMQMEIAAKAQAEAAGASPNGGAKKPGRAAQAVGA